MENDVFKKYDDLSFTDDFLFCYILMNNEALCIELTEMITGRKVRKIAKIHTQKAVRLTKDGKGVRFDVYFEDDERIFDIEMQTTNTGNLRKRVRYYQAMIDMDHINKGGTYNELKESYVIFICTFDLFKKNRHKYTFVNTCIEDDSLVLDDEAYKIFLCAGGNADDCSEKMKDFLDYISGKGANGVFSKKIEAEVEDAHLKEEWRSSYMLLIDRDRQIKEQGREEGRIEGRIEGTIDVLRDLGSPEVRIIDKLMENFNLSFAEAKNYYNMYA